MHLLAVEAVTPGVRDVRAADDLHQRRLAGAVISNDAKNLTRVKGQVDATEGGDRTEALLDSGEFEDPEWVVLPPGRS